MNTTSNAERILFLLKTKGAQTANNLAPMLQMTAMGVRQHLLNLEQQELANSTTESKGVGRPQRIWQLTEKAKKKFPNTHAVLTVELLEAVRSLFGDQGIEDIISLQEQSMLEKYKLALQKSTSVLDKVKGLAKTRSQEGYMAEYKRNKDGSYFLIENHCPICAAATQCQLFCRSELQLFQEVLGKQVRIQREAHLLAEARRCVYRIESIS